MMLIALDKAMSPRVSGPASDAGQFVESDHPRAENGQFGEGTGKTASNIEPDQYIDARRIEPVNDVDADKVLALAENMRANGWQGRPVLAYEGAHGTMAATGSHRIAAAEEASIDVPVKFISEEAANFEDEDGNVLSDLIGTGDDRALSSFLRQAGDDEAAELVDAEISANEADWEAAKDAALAFDRNTVRTFDRDGRLHVATTNISKAAINPYIGREIPDFEALGLDPDRTYKLFRDPEELEKAAPTFNNLPLLSRHVPVSADDHQPDLVVGSTGSEAEFVAPYLRNSLVIWARHAIKGVEDRTKQELSSAYRYRCDMTPGTYDGEAFDGVMRDIVGNHVAIVPEGRAGPDVVVGDAKPSFIIRGEFIMSQKPAVLTRKAIFAQGALLAAIGPKLAQDAKIDLSPVFAGITAKNFKAKSADILAGIKGATKGKLAQDASIEDVAALLDTLDGIDVVEGADIDPNSGLPVPAMKPDDASMDSGSEAIKAFLAGKLSDEDIAKLLSMIDAPAAMDSDDKDEDDKDKPAKDEEPKDMVTKPAMDAAITAAVKAAEDRSAKRQAAIRDAERAVRPYVGDLAMAHDSAEAVYATALTTMGVKVEGIHPSALPAIFAAHPLPGVKVVNTPRVAMDAAGIKSFHERFPGTANIGRA